MKITNVAIALPLVCTHQAVGTIPPKKPADSEVERKTWIGESWVINELLSFSHPSFAEDVV